MESLSPKLIRSFETLGTWMIRVSVVFLLILFAPAAFQELRYWTVTTRQALPFALPGGVGEARGTPSATPAGVEPVDQGFGIIIPKIGANSRVISQVDWRDSRVYQRALTEGVAHAAGSALPGEAGNTFLFAHAGGNPLEALRYNAVFYLLDKLVADDQIAVWYERRRHEYRVIEKKVVSAEAVEYVAAGTEERLTLMTCWPAGTTWKRLLIIAEPLSPAAPAGVSQPILAI